MTRLRSIVVNVDNGRRIVLFPEGGYHTEVHVKGIGWTVDDDNVCLHGLAELLGHASVLLANASDNERAATADDYADALACVHDDR